ncbi:unnamed protein product [Arabidopsis thaliana]|uniref:pectinesterase n=1 Tax=Arabidopsis thaliana TaxID=3702 RepID=A0A7G2EA36_ARATH|nr:unnamed protein product [Arabidopsis thaliana]
MDVKAYTPIQDFSCVDRDLHGCGNFSNVQSAIDAVPDQSSSKTIFNSKLLENVTVNENKTNLIIQGRGYQNTSIEWNDTAKSTGNTAEDSFSFVVFAANFTAYNISFKNNGPNQILVKLMHKQ